MTKLTSIAVGTTPLTCVGNNIKLRGFSLNIDIRPDASASVPTFVRMALVVQRGPFTNPSSVDLLAGPTLVDQEITMDISNAGNINRNQPINPSLFAVIWARTIN